MISIDLRNYLLVMALILGISINAYSAGEFLEVGVGAKALGTGEAFIGKSDDFSASYWNPAGLSFISNILIGSHLLSYYEGIFLNYSSFIFPVKSIGTFGISFTWMGDDFPLTEMDSSGAIVESGNTFSFFDYNLTASYARKITGNIGVGGNFKYISSKIEDESTGTAAFDAGGMIKNLFDSDLSAGLVIVNVGPGLKYIKEYAPLPSSVKFGISKILWTSDNKIQKIVGLNDYIFPFHSEFMLNLGIEYIFKEMIFLRTGYQYSQVKKQISFGTGLDLSLFGNNLYINLVYLISESKLNNLLAFDLSMKFISSPEIVESKDQKKILHTEKKATPLNIYKELVYEDFEAEEIIPKFTAESGEFENVVSEDKKYGKWSLGFEEKDMILQTSIRLPDLSKFTGIMISISSTNISKIKLVLVEESIEGDKKWNFILPGIIGEFQEKKIPFDDFYQDNHTEDNFTAKINPGKISRVEFIIKPEFTTENTEDGWLRISKVLFYKKAEKKF